MDPYMNPYMNHYTTQPQPTSVPLFSNGYDQTFCISGITRVPDSANSRLTLVSRGITGVPDSANSRLAESSRGITENIITNWNESFDEDIQMSSNSFPQYIPPEDHYVVDFMNLLWNFLSHLKVYQLTTANAHFVMETMYNSLVKLVPPKSFVHLVAKPFLMWGVVLEHFQKIFRGYNQTFYLYSTHPENDLDAECDDRFALRLCKEIARCNANVTLVSNDKYTTYEKYLSYSSDATKYFWNNQPSYKTIKLSKDLDNNVETHRIYHFKISENDNHECIIVENRDH